MTFDSLLVELKPHSWLKVFFQNAVAQIRKAKSIKQDYRNVQVFTRNR